MEADRKMSVASCAPTSGTVIWRVSTSARFTRPIARPASERGPSAPTIAVASIALPSASTTRPSAAIARTLAPNRQQAPAAIASRTSDASNAARSIICPGNGFVMSGGSSSTNVIIEAIGCRIERASAPTSTPIIAGTNSAHWTGTPASWRRSTATTHKPRRAAAAAADEPAGPSPTTSTSTRSRFTIPPLPSVNRNSHAVGVRRQFAIARTGSAFHARSRSRRSCRRDRDLRMDLDRAAGLDRAARVLLHGGTTDRMSDRERAFGREGDAVEARRDRVRVGDPTMHARRACAAEQDFALRYACTCVEEDPADVFRARRLERTRSCVERHDDDEHERTDRMPAHDVERARLADDAAVVQADDDVRHDLHSCRAQRGERRLEIVDGAVEMIDVADRLLGPDHVHHRRVHTRDLHQPCAALIEQRRVNRDLQIGIVALELLDDRVEALVADLVTLGRSAGEQESAQVLCDDQVAHLAIEHFGRGRRDHRLEDLRLAVVAHQRAAV